jgi:hypothetical protein
MKFGAQQLHGKLERGVLANRKYNMIKTTKTHTFEKILLLEKILVLEKRLTKILKYQILTLISKP